jgi:DNA ligase-1
MNLITKPMLASKAESLQSLKYPLYASPKLDGIRCVMVANSDGTVSANSRNWKPIPNNYARAWLEENVPAWCDGELMVRVKGSDAEFSQVSSGIMSEDGEPDFYFAIFDAVKTDISTPFAQRLSDLHVAVKAIPKEHIKVVPQVLINNSKELQKFFDKCMSEGFEGAMVRSPEGPYKCGRSTEKEGYLLKIKLFDDAEAVIEGSYVLMHNENEATLDAFGRTERSQKKAGLVETDKLGGFMVRDLKTNVDFDIGTGYNDAQRREFWANRDKMVGRIIKYSFQGLGINQRPRFPVWHGFRDSRDMST